jgi:hypothetical protein
VGMLVVGIAVTPSPKAGASVSPWIGIGAAGVRGSF